jgi:hypothetical protein
LKPVDYSELARDELRGVVVKLMEEQITDEEFRNSTATLIAMGFLPHDADLKASLVDLLSEQIAAFYDQHSHRLFMFRGADLSRTDQRIILAHELTHALQDQHFGLKKFPLELKDNDDKVAATQALIEGDATLVMSMFMLQDIAGGSPVDALSMFVTQPMDQLLKAPQFLRESLVFPYLAGQEFAVRLHTNGGFSEVDRAFAAPPDSTAQIFDPEKYTGPVRVEPVAVRWRDAEVDGEKPLLENTAGELGVRLLFKEWLGKTMGEQVGEGWAGDRYRSFAAGKDGTVHTAWRIKWATPLDAQEYIAGCEKLLAKRYKPGDIRRTAGGCEFDSPRFVRLRRLSPTETLLVEAQDKTWAESLVGAN